VERNNAFDGQWVIPWTNMMQLLRAHPVPIVARFEYGLALTYGFARHLLSSLLAPGLELDTYGDYGFLSVVSVRTRELRPAFLPKAFGHNFCLTSYRLFTRFKTKDGDVLRGHQALRNDTDLAWVVTWGNRLTRYGYRRAPFDYKSQDGLLSLEVTTPNAEADLKFTADTLSRTASPPEGSPFPDIETSRQFAGPLRLTFDYDSESHSMIVVEGRRTNWQPQPVPVQIDRNTFLQSPSFRGFTPVLANAFYFADVPYRWERGRREQLA
jgi:hypothetical protein